jgi:putative aldouronate transport system substrate-binding protein
MKEAIRVKGKRLIAITLGAAIIVTMAACTGSNSTSAPPATTAPAATAAPAATDTPAPTDTQAPADTSSAAATATAASTSGSVPDGTLVNGALTFNPFPNKETFSYPQIIPAGTALPAGQTWDDNTMINFFANLTNVYPTQAWQVVDQPTYDQKISLESASGDLPDAFSCSPAIFAQLVAGGQVMALDDLYNADASAVTQQYASSDPLAWASAHINGKLYGLPQANMYLNNYQFLWYRTDWFKQLGLSAPTSMSDLMTDMQAVKAANLDGAPNCYGLAIDNTFLAPLTGIAWNYGLDSFFAAYGAYPQMWVDDGSGTGTAIYGGITDAAKNVLGTLATMYQNGLLDPEFATKDSTAVDADVGNGVEGIAFASANSAAGMATAVSLDPAYSTPGVTLADPNTPPTRDWNFMLVPTGDGTGTTQYPGFFDVSSYYVINANCKQPEAVIKWMNATNQYWASLNDPAGMGFSTDIHHDATMKDANGNWLAWFDMMGPYLGDPGGQISGYQSTYLPSITKWLVDYNPPTGLTSLSDPNYVANASYIDTATVGWLADWFIDYHTATWAANKEFGLNSTLDTLLNCEPNMNNYMLNSLYLAANTDDMNTDIPTLASLQMTEYTNIITGAVPLSDFDNFVQQWKAAGGDTITGEVNSWLQSQSSSGSSN